MNKLTAVVLLVGLVAAFAVPTTKVSKDKKAVKSEAPKLDIPVDTNDENVASLVEQFRAKAAGIESVTKALDAVKTRISNLLATYRTDKTNKDAECKKAIGDFDDQITAATKSQTTATTNLNNAKSRVTQLTADIRTETSLIDTLTPQKATADKALADKRAAAKAAVDKCTTLKNGYAATLAVIANIRILVSGGTVADPKSKMLLEKLSAHANDASMPADVHALIQTLKDQSLPQADQNTLIQLVDDLKILVEQEAHDSNNKCLTEAAQFAAEIQKLDNDATSLASRLKTATTNRDNLQVSLNSANSQVEQFQREVKSYTDSITSLNGLRSTKQSSCTKELNDIQAMIDAKAKEETDVTTLKTKILAHWATIDTSLTASIEKATIRYEWRANAWGACSTTCGGGSQSRTVDCLDYKLTKVDDSFCNRFLQASAKPGATQACNTQGCPVDCRYTSEISRSSCQVNSNCGSGTIRIQYGKTGPSNGGKQCDPNGEFVNAPCSVSCSDRLNTGAALNHNTNDRLVSGNGRNVLQSTPSGMSLSCNGQNLWNSGRGAAITYMQHDCNLVSYNGPPTWASNTWNQGSGCVAVMQNDCNFVVYTNTGRPVWASNTWRSGQPGALLEEKVKVENGVATRDF